MKQCAEDAVYRQVIDALVAQAQASGIAENPYALDESLWRD